MVQRVSIVIVAVVMLLGVWPVAGETYKSPFSIGCGDIWPAVKATLADQDHYAKVIINDEKMKADFQPKHTVHVDITGTLLQRMNHVKLVPKDSGCEMDVVSNYSGWGHDDQGDFRKRIDYNLTNGRMPLVKPAVTAEAKPAGPGE
ncbi:MAG TPA: hypothetical protein VHZ25_01425 [Acidobacteriaceae bacterium]|jgi:hypothetical protein|nr:hypothetical protein [Acidobacteriaceae bacterium]